MDIIQTMCFKLFIERNSLVLCCNHIKSKKDYTYMNHELGHNSCVDQCNAEREFTTALSVVL